MSDLAALRWRAVSFDALSTTGLYRLLQLRSAVFVVEQACAFQDLDGLDFAAVHLLGEVGDAAGGSERLWAYARLLPAGVAFAEASIGRVVTSPEARGTGLGHALMRQAVAELHRQWGPQPIRIGAQAHLQSFYRQSGFVPQGALYLEDGIEHIEMVRA
ncbi:MAG TPA: GNAT family N-acetyltransferase [Hydrogenophaga sp.]